MSTRTLRKGLSGDDVSKWKLFLKGQFPQSVIVIDNDDVFDDETYELTKQFQSKKLGLTGDDVDGIVGPTTMGHAMIRGFSLLSDDTDPANYPPPPAGFVKPTYQTRVALFGTFTYIPDPVKYNPEQIKLTDNWYKDNITSVNIPQLKGIKGAPASCNVLFHKKVVNQTQELFKHLEREGLLNRIKTWDGSYSARFIRGSQTSLSNHSWGVAFDINAQWNGLGARPVLKGKDGSVRELVTIAYEHGYSWGGHYKERPDGMHFEVYKVV